ncbi:hypothetical protein LOTGIDRAFT_239302 [Lottia gigantea]|uniref:Uncharacterized protein n=1 Tax=Lottia gigantea TaxID=225164 RepID=V4AI48_LOTGI|nr:hypothetical protein LOTGIDRAFT_239302 [Lottia gigantea]ESO96597.1 hypothetical protein LOTGIDRAFT_239302 [Lottia gigantea]
MDDQGTVTTLPDGTEFIPRPLADQDRQSHTSASSSSRSLTMTYNKLPDANISESVTYIDAISYFCDMMVEKELQAIRRGQSAQPATKSTEKLAQNKNTVLVLPRIPRKQALVRLGETHTLSSKQRKDKNKYCLPSVLTRGRHQIPGDITGFVPAINLPLKTVYMNPFPNPLDAYDARFQEPVLITLKSEQKFFIQTNSIVPIEYAAAPSS